MLLAITTFCAYSQVQYHEFINYDDNFYVTKNQFVQSDLSSESIIRIFTNTDAHIALYVPITTLSYLLDYHFYGLNPKGFLLTNLFFHITNSLLLFLVLFRMTDAIWKSAFVATMFALHPLNVESVAWISERKNVLSTLFFFLTIMAYTNYAEKPSIKTYSLVFLFFTMGLMSKPMLVTLPFLLLLLDYWPLRRFKFGHKREDKKFLEKNDVQKSKFFRLVLEKTPLFLLTISFTSLMFYHVKTNFGFYFSLQTRITSATVSYLGYLRKMVWPTELSIFYPHPGNTLPAWQGIACGMALVVITLISIKLIKKAPYFAVGWFWYLGTLVPVIGVFQVTAFAMADHYSYITLIGIFIIVAWGLPEVLSKLRCKKQVLSVSVGILILIMMTITWKQVSQWKNSVTVFKHAIRVTDEKHPNFSLAYNNLGQGLYTEGKKEEAISNYKMAIKLNPMHAKAYYNLGVSLYDEGKNEEAISNYKLAVKIRPDFAYAHYNLGLILFEERKLKEATYHFKKTVRLRPDLVTAQHHLELAKRRLREFK